VRGRRRDSNLVEEVDQIFNVAEKAIETLDKLGGVKTWEECAEIPAGKLASLNSGSSVH
jgi:hypothetical protein